MSHLTDTEQNTKFDMECNKILDKMTAKRREVVVSLPKKKLYNYVKNYIKYEQNEYTLPIDLYVIIFDYLSFLIKHEQHSFEYFNDNL